MGTVDSIHTTRAKGYEFKSLPRTVPEVTIHLKTFRHIGRFRPSPDRLSVPRFISKKKSSTAAENVTTHLQFGVYDHQNCLRSVYIVMHRIISIIGNVLLYISQMNFTHAKR